jgi:Na+:H+ antiporter, NhaA family
MTVPEERAVRYVWHRSDRFVPRRFVRPALALLQLEAAGGIVLLVGALAALVWANSPWEASYRALWSTPVTVEIGAVPLHHLASLDLLAVVNDGLMALFFFVVALEIKRELVSGELRDPRAAALPVIAAVGGMIVPALIYTGFAAGTAGAHGWGIPMATDIAFAVGIMSLVPGVPTGARLFLLTLAIVDDLGAIVVIAVAYTSDLHLGWLVASLGGLAVTALVARSDVRAQGPYWALGIVVWLCVLESGVHATLAGVAMGFLTPSWSFYNPGRFSERARPLVDDVNRSFADGLLTVDESERNDDALDNLMHLANESRSPLDRMVRRLGPWTAYVIVPVFAFANAGIRFPPVDTLGQPVVVGVAVGLVVGKAVGIFAVTWAALRMRICVLPPGVGLRELFGSALCAGVGFTVALFVASLSFPDDPALGDEARLGILVGSLVAGVLGYTWLRATTKRRGSAPERSPAGHDPATIEAPTPIS